MMDTNLAPLLLVEDSDLDFEATLRALRRSGVDQEIVRCADGDDALEYLHGRGRYADSRRPALVLLDLNLPGTDGRDVLHEMKRDPDLRQIPVVVLTTSNAEADVASCYAEGANCYIQKAVDLGCFNQAIATLAEFWFRHAVLPPQTV